MRTIWQTMIQPKLDYCSQLWSPGDQESINKIENVQRNFLSKVTGMRDMHYWSQLKTMSLSSQERRRERYMIIFLWKISQHMVDGYEVPFYVNPRRGRLIVLNHSLRGTASKVRKARDCSLAIKGAKLFNLLPAYIRNIDSEDVTLFRYELDSFLSGIPDEPTIRGSSRGAESNSLLHQIPLLRRM